VTSPDRRLPSRLLARQRERWEHLARQREARLLLLIFLLALVVRLAYAHQIRDLPTLHALVMDAERYDREAREILDHGWWPSQVFFQAPLYPYLLAVVYALSGRSVAAVRLLQAVLGAATAVLAAVAAARLTGPDPSAETAARGAWGQRQAQTAGMAGLLAALYAPAVFYTPLLLKTVPILFLEAAAAVFLLPHGGPGPRVSPWRACWAGLALGTAALLQENLLLLAPAAALYLLVAEPAAARRSLPRASLAAVALVVAAVLPAVLVMVANYRVGGELMAASPRGGMNFYIGNHRGASGIYVPLSNGSQRPDYMFPDGQRLAALWQARDSGRAVTPASITPARASAIFWRESGREIDADRLAWARLMLRKTRLFWNSYEIPDAEGFRVTRYESTVLRFDPVVFGLVAPLAAVGLVAAWRRGGAARRAALLLALCAVTTWLTVVLFFVLGRYRLAVVPFLLPLAGAGALELIEIGGRGVRRGRRLAGGRTAALERSEQEATSAALERSEQRPPSTVWLAVLAGVALAVNLPCYTAAEMDLHDSAIEYNLGHAGLRWSAACYSDFLRAWKGGGGTETPEARESLAQAVALASRAAGYFAEAVAANPGFFAAELERATALERRGAYLALAGRLAPALADYGEAHRGLAAALAETTGATDVNPDLLAAAQRMMGVIDAGTASALNNLGGHLIEARQLERAQEALERAVALAPRSPAPRGNLALCWFQRGLAARRGGAEAEAVRFFIASRDSYRQAVELSAAAGRGDQAALYRQGVALAEAELSRRSPPPA
jgi:tetratricopeptide (TPR) repeat protein